MNRHVAAGVMLAGVGLIWGSAAQADDGGWYFGLSGALTTTSTSSGDIDNAFVAGLQADVDDLDLVVTSASIASDLDDSDKAYGVHIGYRFNRWVAAEVGYLDLGKFTYQNRMDAVVDDGVGGFPPETLSFDGDYRLRVNGPFASVLGIFAISDRFDVHVRGGLLFADTRVRVRRVQDDFPETFTSTQFTDSSAEFFGGIGAAWNINDSYSLRIEYQKFLDVGGARTGEDDIDAVNVAILFR